MTNVTIQITTSTRDSYPLIIESDAVVIQELKAIINNGGYKECFVLYDANLLSVAQSIAKEVNADLVEIAPGEQSKCFSEVERICTKLLELGADRKSIIVNVGGGMLTDLGGFIASIYMRGIDFVNIPTSLLGMVDASIGGKTGIDLNGTKNSVGSYAHPIAILVDTDVLGSLPDIALREGLVEVIKMAAVLDKEHFLWLEKNLDGVLAREKVVLEKSITLAAEMKASVIGGDERDAGKRQLLNFGHTVGHAVEALSNFSISHGKAVSIGMVIEMMMADTKDPQRLVSYLEKMDMPTSIPSEMSTEALWEIMKNDKKNVGDDVRIAVATEIGGGELQTITFDQFHEVVHG